MDAGRVVLTHIVVSTEAFGSGSFDVDRDHGHAAATTPGHSSAQLFRVPSVFHAAIESWLLFSPSQSISGT